MFLKKIVIFVRHFDFRVACFLSNRPRSVLRETHNYEEADNCNFDGCGIALVCFRAAAGSSGVE